MYWKRNLGDVCDMRNILKTFVIGLRNPGRHFSIWTEEIMLSEEGTNGIEAFRPRFGY